MFKFTIPATESAEVKIEPVIKTVLPSDLENDDTAAKKVCEMYLDLLDDEYAYKTKMGFVVQKPVRDISSMFSAVMSIVHGNTLIYLMTIEDDVIGMACIKKTQQYVPNSIKVSNVVIDKKYRGNGYGTMLMKRVIKDTGKQPIQLNVFALNEAGNKLYKSLGFEPISIVMLKNNNPTSQS